MDITSFLLGYKSGAAKGGASADVRYVTFYNYDETLIGTKPVAVGDDCRYIFGTPTRPSTAQYSYTHNGWATTQGGTADGNALKAVNDDRTLYATYKATVRSYTITYYDSDGTTVLKTETLAYGATPSYVPEKDGYVFDSWTPAVATVTGNASYTAAWRVKETLNDFTWAQLDAMSLEECKSKFSIGDKKTVEFVASSASYKFNAQFTLVGFEVDDLADGSGKAKMSFIAGNIGASGCWGTDHNKILYWPDSNHKKNFMDNFSAWSAKSEDHAALNAVIKSVVKKYVNSDNSSTNPTFATVDEKYWMPSMKELGFSGSGICDEGERYPYFENHTVTELDAALNYVAAATRSIYPAYISWGKWIVNKGAKETIKQSDNTNRYVTVGFCI